ncbi:hypothetical protein B0H11DRAFT_1913980 [Mycena galericulata]|nr:hypothetical protein B0H11DRAFT_1913980 [Mycena galericulata]
MRDGDAMNEPAHLDNHATSAEDDSRIGEHRPASIVTILRMLDAARVNLCYDRPRSQAWRHWMIDDHTSPARPFSIHRDGPPYPIAPSLPQFESPPPCNSLLLKARPGLFDPHLRAQGQEDDIVDLGAKRRPPKDLPVFNNGQYSRPQFGVLLNDNPALELFETAVAALNPQVVVKAAAPPCSPDGKSVVTNTRIQILDTMLMLPDADKQQRAAFIRDERVLIVYSAYLDDVIPTPQDFEDRLIKFLSPTLARRPAARRDPAHRWRRHRVRSRRRQFLHLRVQWACSSGAVSFFALQLIQNVTMCIGPVAHFHENDSAIKLPRSAYVVLANYNIPKVRRSASGLKRADRFKKVNNMKYWLKGLLKAKQHLAVLVAVLIAAQGWVNSIDNIRTSIGGLNQKPTLAKFGAGFHADAPGSGHLLGMPHRMSFASNAFGETGSFTDVGQYGIQYQNREGDDIGVWGEGFCEDFEERVLEMAIEEMYEERGRSTTQDYLRDATRELNECPPVPILHHKSDVMRVKHHYFENGSRSYPADQQVTPLMEHNPFLRWKAMQDVAFIDLADGKEKIWSESNVAEGFGRGVAATAARAHDEPPKRWTYLARISLDVEQIPATLNRPNVYAYEASDFNQTSMSESQVDQLSATFATSLFELGTNGTRILSPIDMQAWVENQAWPPTPFVQNDYISQGRVRFIGAIMTALRRVYSSDSDIHVIAQIAEKPVNAALILKLMKIEPITPLTASETFFVLIYAFSVRDGPLGNIMDVNHWVHDNFAPVLKSVYAETSKLLKNAYKNHPKPIEFEQLQRFWDDNPHVEGGEEGTDVEMGM